MSLPASIQLIHSPIISGDVLQLPSSKSISNRALLLDALSHHKSTLHNLSNARDTKLMQQWVNHQGTDIDVQDAGTTMRFLTAYYAITNQHKIITGSARMKERPMTLLVDALRDIGAQILYVEKNGFPPLAIQGFASQKKNHIQIPANVSSQYISALMMIAPILPNGLTIALKGDMGSAPYITMTASLMKLFGVEPWVDFANGQIIISNRAYTPTELTIESDWSAASYWLACCALADQAELFIPNISSQSLQGDAVIIDIMNHLGVHTSFQKNGMILSKCNSEKQLSYDFKIVLT